ncbi:hypothetical protein J6590_089080 [Homalodisca vitripennis]|nr:hypothetical protein J6590_089080 [Homalodisca vitripennis]
MANLAFDEDLIIEQLDNSDIEGFSEDDEDLDQNYKPSSEADDDDNSSDDDGDVTPTPTSPVAQANQQKSNRLWKVQPIIDAVRKRCLELERGSGTYSIDEQIIPFLGSCPVRQVVKNKPRPVGLKKLCYDH